MTLDSGEYSDRLAANVVEAHVIVCGLTRRSARPDVAPGERYWQADRVIE